MLTGLTVSQVRYTVTIKINVGQYIFGFLYFSFYTEYIDLRIYKRICITAWCLRATQKLLSLNAGNITQTVDALCTQRIVTSLKTPKKTRGSRILKADFCGIFKIGLQDHAIFIYPKIEKIFWIYSMDEDELLQHYGYLNTTPLHYGTLMTNYR